MTKQEAFTLLRSGEHGVHEWNLRRAEGQVMPDMDHLDFSFAPLDGANLSSMNFVATNFRKAEVVRADLRTCDLRKADFAGAYFFETDFSQADLSMADLSSAEGGRSNFSDAKLVKSNLASSYLRSAILRNADLTKASLRESELNEADLRGANLTQAELIRTDLRSVNLDQAIFGGTILIGLYLGKTTIVEGARATPPATGLEGVVHAAPSIIEASTFARSRGKISELFLRGCGLSDWEIEAVRLHDPSLTTMEQRYVADRIMRTLEQSPLNLPSLFISYSYHDNAFARKLYEDLQAAGIRCWFAPHDMKAGEKIHEQIREAIQKHDRLLVILSESSMNSMWVQTEIASARERETKEELRVLFPVRLVGFERIRQWEYFDADIGSDSAREIREYFIPDFSEWNNANSYKTAFERLLEDLRAASDRLSSS